MLTATQKEFLKKLEAYKQINFYQGGYWSQPELLVPESPKADDFKFYFSSVTANALIVLDIVEVAEYDETHGIKRPVKIALKD